MILPQFRGVIMETEITSYEHKKFKNATWRELTEDLSPDLMCADLDEGMILVDSYGQN